MEANNPAKKGPSSAYNPDLDWSQIRETFSMICLAVVQIETSLKESSTSMNQLTDNFTHIAMEASRINGDVTKDSDEAKQSIIDSTQAIQGKVTESITSFQFYDRITQRLEHVTQGLMNLNELISDPSCLYNPEAWRTIQDGIKESYSMECERIMFEQVMQGMPIEEVIETYNHDFEQRHLSQEEEDSEDDIELF